MTVRQLRQIISEKNVESGRRVENDEAVPVTGEKLVKPNPIVTCYLKHNPVENNLRAASQRRSLHPA